MAQTYTNHLEDGEIEDGELSVPDPLGTKESKASVLAEKEKRGLPSSSMPASLALQSERGSRDVDGPDTARVSPHLSPHLSPHVSPQYSPRGWRYRDRYADSVDWPLSSRDRKDALDSLRGLTKHLTIQDALRPGVGLETVSQDIMAAIRKLDWLWQSVQRGCQLSIEGDAECSECAERIFKGLRAVHAVCGTGAGRAQNLAAAKQAMRTAWQFQTAVFTTLQRNELDSWIRTSKHFREVLDELEPTQVQQQLDRHREPGELEQGEIHSAEQQAPTRAPAEASAPDPEDVPRKRQKLDSSPAHNAAAEGVAPPSEPADIAASHTNSHARSTTQSVTQITNPDASLTAHRHVPGDALPPPAEHHGSGQDVSNGQIASSDGHVPAAHEDMDVDLTLLQEDVHSLVSAGRLCLVLDLDHTLLNSVRFSDVDGQVASVLQRRVEHEALLPIDQRQLFCLPAINTWTKLRPGVRNFLATAHKHFELWIHTNGNRVYANAMAELLDPTREYFGHRIIAQGSTGQDESPASAQVTKRLMAGLEGRESIAIIVDDTEAVWPHDLRNLFVVERYIYFPSAARQFGIQGSCLFEIGRDECPKTGMLATALGVCTRVHSTAFHYMEGVLLPSGERVYPSWDVRNVLAEERRKVLEGCTLVFTRVIPLDQAPHLHKVWLLAESFGATCSANVGHATTHVVAGSRGTDKVGVLVCPLAKGTRGDVCFDVVRS